MKALRDVLEEYQALIVLTGQYNAAVRHERERAIAELDALTRRELPAGDAIVRGTYQLTRVNVEGEPPTEAMI